MRTARTALAALAAAALVLSPAVSFASGTDESDLKTKLSGANEVPGPGDEDGKGKFKADLTDTTLCYQLTAKNIAEATAAHIHVGDSETAGPVAVTLEAPSDGKSKACLTAVPDEEDTAATLGESELAALTADSSGYYVNVHNADFPAGAIRGQL